MQVEIITIGDEILIGQIVDTNSAWMAQQLNTAGISVKQITSVSDDGQAIINALNEAKARVDIILITGGLGPTKDDLTKSVLCTYFNSGVRFDEHAFGLIKKLFFSKGVLNISEINRKQAEVPEKCMVLPNPLGTAPGMWFDFENKVFVSMPGVPFEMKAMMENEVIPRLKERFKTPHIFHKTILTQGIGESSLSEMISEWEDQLPHHIRLAYLPAPGSVRLRLSGKGEDKQLLEEQVVNELEKVKPLIAQYIYGYDNDTLEGILGQLLKKEGKTVSTAESCTGGYIAHLITSVPGSSAYYEGSFVTYSYLSKEILLGVNAKTLAEYGAVSEQVVREMARGAQERIKSDYAIACTGIAGPGGGLPGKPVGTVWIAIATPEKIITQHFLFGNNRERNIHKTAITAFNMLIKELSY